MATVSALPGSLNIALVRGDEFGTTVDVKLELAGYSFAAEVFSLLTGDTLATPTVVYVGPSLDSTGTPVAGWSRISLSMTETQTASLTIGSYGFRVSWIAPGNAKRTALAGVCEVK
jgi:hypothetical protein